MTPKQSPLKSPRRGEVRARLVRANNDDTRLFDYFTLPADPESVGRMREQVAVALANWGRKKADLSQIKDLFGYHPLDANKLRLDADAVLASLRLLAGAGKGGKAR